MCIATLGRHRLQLFKYRNSPGAGNTEAIVLSELENEILDDHLTVTRIAKMCLAKISFPLSCSAGLVLYSQSSILPFSVQEHLLLESCLVAMEFASYLMRDQLLR